MTLLSLQINTLIENFRRTIPVDSATARAIDRKDSRRKIVLYAKTEGHIEFAKQLEQAVAARPEREATAEDTRYPHGDLVDSTPSSN
jgi:hypothetical protein